MAAGSSILAWKIPWVEKPGGATIHEITKSWALLSTRHSYSVTPVLQGKPV